MSTKKATPAERLAGCQGQEYFCKQKSSLLILDSPHFRQYGLIVASNSKTNLKKNIAHQINIILPKNVFLHRCNRQYFYMAHNLKTNLLIPMKQPCKKFRLFLCYDNHFILFSFKKNLIILTLLNKLGYLPILFRKLSILFFQL